MELSFFFIEKEKRQTKEKWEAQKGKNVVFS